ncbi:MAG: rod shape-determining protein MreC [Bacteroidia bacterium]|jgi:rod shape-determining protein MreC|nr:rod shape-determining protein MreC [Bacteroidia bacterium]
MLVIFRWIRNQAHFLLFILLLLSSVTQIFRYHIYQHSIYFGQALGAQRQLDAWKSDIKSYFNLKNVNQQLIAENTLLKQQLNWNLTFNSPRRDSTYRDTNTGNFVKYEYIQARVIRNSVQEQNNFIILDRGFKDGIKRHMSVVSPMGIVGVVVESAEHYSLVMSVLNSKFEITPYFYDLKTSQGVISWNGEDPTVVDLEEVNRFVNVRNGMKLFTSNYSLLFPAGIPIGTIVSSNSNLKSNFHRIKVKLATDFGQLDVVSVIKNTYQKELDVLNQAIPSSNTEDKND